MELERGKASGIALSRKTAMAAFFAKLDSVC